MSYLVFGLLVFIYICKSDGHYYWKDYHNKIPFDAFVAGEDINQEKVYIGQVFVKGELRAGIYPTSIVRGKNPLAPILGARKADNFIQILCSNDAENLKWLPTNSTHLHLLKTNNELVRGGIEEGSWVNIGRLKYQGGTSVGKVLSKFVGGADFWFVHNENEIKAQYYEVLTYNDIAGKIFGRYFGG